MTIQQYDEHRNECAGDQCGCELYPLDIDLKWAVPTPLSGGWVRRQLAFNRSEEWSLWAN